VLKFHVELSCNYMQTNSEKRVWFYGVCRANGIVLSDLQLDQIETYVNLLLDWNKKINLVSRKDEENIWTFHILHSISLLFHIELPQGCRIVDIGTGGGLPGIPIKIFRPDISILCLDSTGKKIKAVSEMILDLHLNNITAIWGRAEEIGVQKEHAGTFDFAFARAVAPLSDLVGWAKPFLKMKPGNVAIIERKEKFLLTEPALLVYKGGELTKEVEMAKKKYTDIQIILREIVFEKSFDLNVSDKKLIIVDM
jgi:16S rRNA (guanine(527)-N(7))-methyltransferase RsmG